MKLIPIDYAELSAKQKEIFNFQKVAAILADYGFNCIKLADDWQGADFLAYHKDGQETLKVQLKSRLTISQKYVGKNLYMAFPIKGEWCLIGHDELLRLLSVETNWLTTKSWLDHGNYSSGNPSKKLSATLRSAAGI